jgi:hypothetical protein
MLESAHLITPRVRVQDISTRIRENLTGVVARVLGVRLPLGKNSYALFPCGESWGEGVSIVDF